MTQSILFVCLGNICRSPTAEGVFRTLVDSDMPAHGIKIDSAGTIGYHAGSNADSRAITAAGRRGYDLSKIISRQVKDSDFKDFDLILAMDNENLRNLHAQANAAGHVEAVSKIRLFLDYAPSGSHSEVPDPYYGGNKGFDLVIDLIESASRGLITELKSKN